MRFSLIRISHFINSIKILGSIPKVKVSSCGLIVLLVWLFLGTMLRVKV